MKHKRIVGTAIVTTLLLVLLCAMIAPAAAYSYNRQAAVDYAMANAYRDVPGSWYFKNHGGDCTNFVSHALKAGGWRQVSTNTNPALNWYYNGPAVGDRSSSWTGVDPFGEFAVASGRSIEVTFAEGTCYLPSFVPIRIGDVIQLDGLRGSSPDGRWDHTMIVTKVYIVGGHFKLLKVTQHSDNVRDRWLSDVLRRHPNGEFRALLLKDTYSS